MLLPKRVKYRRVQRGRLTGKALRGNTISNGEYGLQALEPAWITSNQIEAQSPQIRLFQQLGNSGGVTGAVGALVHGVTPFLFCGAGAFFTGV